MTPRHSADGIALHHGDCREVLPRLLPGLPAGTVVVTDPPYGTGGWRRPAPGRGKNARAELIREAWDDGAVDWLALTPFPVVTFWPAARAHLLLPAAVATGRTKHRLLALHKPDPKPQVEGRVRWSLEPIWVLSEEGFVLYGETDLLTASTPRRGRDREAAGHPYQKPLSLMRWVLAKLPPGSTVLDPFAGSGTTLVAARELGVPAVGIERDEGYCEIAVRRLSGLQPALPFAVAP